MPDVLKGELIRQIHKCPAADHPDLKVHTEAYWCMGRIIHNKKQPLFLISDALSLVFSTGLGAFFIGCYFEKSVKNPLYHC